MFYRLYWDNVVLTQIPMIDTSNELIEEFKRNGVINIYRNAPPEKMHSAEFQYLALEFLIACQSIKKQNKSYDWIIFNNVADGFNTIDSEDLL